MAVGGIITTFFSHYLLTKLSHEGFQNIQTILGESFFLKISLLVVNEYMFMSLKIFFELIAMSSSLFRFLWQHRNWDLTEFSKRKSKVLLRATGRLSSPMFLFNV